MPTSLTAPEICDREFMSGLNVRRGLHGVGSGRVGLGGGWMYTHIHIYSLTTQSSFCAYMPDVAPEVDE